MDREPAVYSRPLVVAGLLPLLLVDSYVGVPTTVFLAWSLLVLAGAAAIHVYGSEPRAGVGWLLFGAAVPLVTLVDLGANAPALVGVVVLVGLGLFLFVSQRFADDE